MEGGGITVLGVLFLFLLSILACVAGVGIFGVAQSAVHEIEAALCFVVGALLLVAAILAAIESKFGRLLTALRNLRDEEAQREKTRSGLAEERWEILAASLDKLEAAVKKNRPVSSVGDDFQPADDPLDDGFLRVRCGNCGKTVKAKSDWAGKRGRCPSCGAAVEFPASAGIDDLL